MYYGLFPRNIIIEGIYSGIFLIGFHLVAQTLFQMFLVFAIFLVFLRVRVRGDFAELRAQNYLLLRYIRKRDEDLASLATNMEGVFDGGDLLNQFTDERKDFVSAEYSGQIFSRAVSIVAQAWMLGFIVWSL